jgi:membrane protease subunit HflC
MRYRTLAIVILVLLASGLLGRAVFVVDTTEHAVVTRFGRPVRTCTAAGLYGKMPLVDQVTRIDARLLVTEPPPSEYLTLDKKNVVARTFVTWQVADPLRYLQSVVFREAAEARLAAVTSSELGAAFGAVPFDALVSADPAMMRLGAILAQVEARVRDAAAAQFGIAVASVGLERLSFPQQNEASVFQRMRAERQRIAKRFRSEGEEQSLKIRAAADRERARILAKAQRKAVEIRGAAEAEAARVYADALAQAPDFYRFLRTLESYDKFVDKDTTIVLPADAPLMKSLLAGPPARSQP